mmetsp:Transcript_10069/g.30399  ORF Transcript_10069/g.30399 Transcript_10069/m.30399 type:complete len:294 (-) Transcript_10069:252-1133(-)
MARLTVPPASRTPADATARTSSDSATVAVARRSAVRTVSVATAAAAWAACRCLASSSLRRARAAVSRRASSSSRKHTEQYPRVAACPKKEQPERRHFVSSKGWRRAADPVSTQWPALVVPFPFLARRGGRGEYRAASSSWRAIRGAAGWGVSFDLFGFLGRGTLAVRWLAAASPPGPSAARGCGARFAFAGLTLVACGGNGEPKSGSAAALLRRSALRRSASSFFCFTFSLKRAFFLSRASCAAISAGRHSVGSRGMRAFGTTSFHPEAAQPPSPPVLPPLPPPNHPGPSPGW